MTVSHEAIGYELSLFTDLGTDPPRLVTSGTDLITKMSRDGETLKIVMHDLGRGKVTTTNEDDIQRTHTSYRAMLASELFGDLRRWADSQYEVLSRELGAEDRLLPPEGALSPGGRIDKLEAFDNVLAARTRASEDSTHVLLIDGPAGIGKTFLIQRLARSRAKDFKIDQRPLILHVQSRGRVLNNIQDLMAFSLQTLRLRVTYDQVPILVRNGLVVLAIDGFDELGDPNGYETAWAQVNDLVSFVRGQGTLILAGRETFIGRDLLIRHVGSIRQGIDSVDTLTLNMPTASIAIDWLRQKGWNEQALSNSAIDALLEDGSYALRPFFLTLLAEHGELFTVDRLSSGYLLQILVDQMIDREAGKFGEPVDSSLDISRRRNFVEQLLCEVSREMADNQTEAIDETSLSWLVDATVESDVPSEVVSILRNRSHVMAFLTTDDRQRFRRFSHSQIQNYFLNKVTIQTIANDEIPKYIRRNLFGPEALFGFCEYISDLAIRKPDEAKGFVQGALRAVRTNVNSDRGNRNLGSLLFACLSASEPIGPEAISDLDVDDAVIQGSAPSAKIARVSLNQLDARGANLELLEFEGAQLSSLILDQSTRVSLTFPIPAWATYDNGRETQVVTDARQISQLLNEHGRVPAAALDDDVTRMPSDIREHGLYRLLDKLCRLKQYWIKSDGDERAGKLLASRWWPRLNAMLIDHDLLRAEKSSGSGKPGYLYHIKHPQRILAADLTDHDMGAFYSDLADLARTLPDDC